MLSDRELTRLFASVVSDDAADPTFLDELFGVLEEEVRQVNRDARRLGARPASRGSWRAPWRPFLATAAVIIAMIAGLGILARHTSTVGTPTEAPSPTATAIPTATAQPSVAPTPGATQPVVPATTQTRFVSAAYGYRIDYPSNWLVRRSTSQLASSAYPYDTSDSVDYFSATAPNVEDPGLIIAAVTTIPGTSLATWMAEIQQLQATWLSCPAAESNEAVIIGGDPGGLLTWTHCPNYLLWAGVLHGGRGYHVIVLDRYAADNPTVQAADKALLQRTLASFVFTTPGASPKPS